MRWMSWLTETNVPRRMVCLVMMPNQISIWFIQLEPTGMKNPPRYAAGSSRPALVAAAQVEYQGRRGY